MELLQHLSQNRTEPVYEQQHDEVLKRVLLDVMAGVDADDADQDHAAPKKHYNAARLAAGVSSEVSQRTDIRKLLYSPSLPFTLGTLMRLGPPFSQSRFLNLVFLRDLIGIHAGVSPSVYVADLQRVLTNTFQFFCQMFKDSLRDLDLLITALPRTFRYGEVGDLMEKHNNMEEFLSLGTTKAGQKAWFEKAGVAWEEVYQELQEALSTQSLQGAGGRRQELVTSGVTQILADAYVTHALPPTSQTTDLRDVGSTRYASRMASYVEDVVERLKGTLQLASSSQTTGTWRDQIRSKIRFLASSRNGLPARPFFCLEYLIHIHHEFCRTPDAIKEVSSFSRYHCPAVLG